MFRPPARALRFAALAALAGATGAVAGTVYVPLPGVTTVGSADYETQVVATNPTTAATNVATFQIANDTDGTVRSGGTSSFAVAAKGTAIARPTASSRGLLELTGSADLSYSARLAGKATPEKLGTPLPVITSENVYPASGVLALHGLTRTATRITDVVLINLSSGFSATCTATFFTSAGAAQGTATTVTLKPLSSRHYADVLGPQASALADVRMALTCNREFFAYGLVTDSASGQVLALDPAASGSSSLQVPGSDPPCPPGASCFYAKGLVHKPTPAAPVGRVSFPAPAGTFKRLRLSLEVTVGPFYPADPDGKHLVYWFVVNKNLYMPGMLYFRGPDAYTALARHGWNLTHPQKLKIVQPFQGVPGRTYRVVHDYDMGGHKVTITITDVLSGELKATLTDLPNVGSVTLKTTDNFIVDMGFVENLTPDEVPSYDWNYSNLRIEAYK